MPPTNRSRFSLPHNNLHGRVCPGMLDDFVVVTITRPGPLYVRLRPDPRGLVIVNNFDPLPDDPHTSCPRLGPVEGVGTVFPGDAVVSYPNCPVLQFNTSERACLGKCELVVGEVYYVGVYWVCWLALHEAFLCVRGSIDCYDRIKGGETHSMPSVVTNVPVTSGALFTRSNRGYGRLSMNTKTRIIDGAALCTLAEYWTYLDIDSDSLATEACACDVLIRLVARCLGITR